MRSLFQQVSSRRGFTLVELLAVVAVILILFGLLVPALGMLRGYSMRVSCTSNMNGLQQGWIHFAADNDGKLARSGTSDPALDWATYWDLRIGVLWPYVNNVKSYACPAYPEPQRTELKRHYSMNYLMDGYRCSCGQLHPYFGGKYHAVTLSQIKSVSKSYCFIEEFDHRAVNSGPYPGAQGGFVGIGLNNPCIGNWDGRMIDEPANWHQMGAVFSFMDGHVEYKAWEGPMMARLPYGRTPSDRWNHTTWVWTKTGPDGRDWAYFASAYTNAFH